MPGRPKTKPIFEDRQDNSPSDLPWLYRLKRRVGVGYWIREVRSDPEIPAGFLRWIEAVGRQNKPISPLDAAPPRRRFGNALERPAIPASFTASGRAAGAPCPARRRVIPAAAGTLELLALSSLSVQAEQPSAGTPLQLSCLKGTGGDKLARAASLENARGAANPQGFAERACGGRGLAQGRQEPGGVIRSGRRTGEPRCQVLSALEEPSRVTLQVVTATRGRPGQNVVKGALRAFFGRVEGHASGTLPSQAQGHRGDNFPHAAAKKPINWPI